MKYRILIDTSFGVTLLYKSVKGDYLEIVCGRPEKECPEFKLVFHDGDWLVKASQAGEFYKYQLSQPYQITKKLDMLFRDEIL